MKLLSINVSKPKPIQYGGKTVHTGIFKEPVSGTVMLREKNIEGDGQGDLRVHGGTYKAIYGYPFEHYAYWQQELRRNDLTYGQFGENLTVEGLLEDAVHIGDVFQIGDDSKITDYATARALFQVGIQNGIARFSQRVLRKSARRFLFPSA